jgi:hypothetical protein
MPLERYSDGPNDDFRGEVASQERRRDRLGSLYIQTDSETEKQTFYRQIPIKSSAEEEETLLEPSSYD